MIFFARSMNYVSGTLNLEVINAFVGKDYFGFMVGGTLYLKIGLYLLSLSKNFCFSVSKLIGLNFPIHAVLKFFDQSKKISFFIFYSTLYLFFRLFFLTIISFKSSILAL